MYLYACVWHHSFPPKEFVGSSLLYLSVSTSIDTALTFLLVACVPSICDKYSLKSLEA